VPVQETTPVGPDRLGPAVCPSGPPCSQLPDPKDDRPDDHGQCYPGRDCPDDASDHAMAHLGRLDDQITTAYHRRRDSENGSHELFHPRSLSSPWAGSLTFPLRKFNLDRGSFVLSAVVLYKGRGGTRPLFARPCEGTGTGGHRPHQRIPRPVQPG